MLRIALGLALGLALAVGVVFACETLDFTLWPPPPGMSSDDPNAVAAAMAAVPAAALAAVLTGWVLGALIGGGAAAFVARRVWPAQVVAVIVLAMALLNMSLLPHPGWMWLGALVLLPLSGWSAGRFGAKLQSAD